MPGWQALHDELGALGFTVIGVALDDGPDDVRPFTDGITFPVLLDPQHVTTELYAISNVPTVIWIDEENRIVRPNGVAYGTDLFKEFTGVDAAPHLDEVRRWVRNGEVPITREDARTVVGALSGDEVRARLHFRIGAEARRGGDEDAAKRHFDRAAQLAPDDWTIRRASMPLLGDDPFGPAFFEFYEEWQRNGRPYHGLGPTMAAGEAPV
ncbi:MAG: redoxin domain-containing protein [Actinobacteria bacterium]|nr:redoxin domain-containing protein [Actinomycetota bacterium]